MLACWCQSTSYARVQYLAHDPIYVLFDYKCHIYAEPHNAFHPHQMSCKIHVWCRKTIADRNRTILKWHWATRFFGYTSTHKSQIPVVCVPIVLFLVSETNHSCLTDTCGDYTFLVYSDIWSITKFNMKIVTNLLKHNHAPILSSSHLPYIVIIIEILFLWCM